MKNRPQSAIIQKIYKEKQEFGLNNSQTYQPKKMHQHFHSLAPKEFIQDQEQLYFINLSLKQKINQLNQEIQQLRAQIIQMNKTIQKNDKVDRYQLNNDPLGVKQNGEGSIVPILKAKVKQQRNQIYDLQNDLHLQMKSIKLTNVQELQMDIQNYQNEILELKQVIQSMLNINDQDIIKDQNITEKLSKFIIIIHQQENQINQLRQEKDKQRQEYQEISEQNQNLQYELKQSNFEKINFKKQLEEQLITESDIYQKEKRKILEKKLQDTLKSLDILKGELSLYENKCKQLTKQLRDQEKEYKQIISEITKLKQNLEDQIQKKDYYIQDLNDRLNIVDLLKQNSSPKLSDSPLLLKKDSLFIPPTVYRDEEIQFPDILSQNEEFNTEPIDQQLLNHLLKQLKYQLVFKKMNKERLFHCFNNQEYIQLSDAIDLFMKQPFNFSKNNAIILSRYLIGEDNGNSHNIQMQDTQNVKDVINTILNHQKIKSDYFTYFSMFQWNQKIRRLYKEIKCLSLEKIIFSTDEFAILLRNNFNLSYELIDMILLINYQFLNEIEYININELKQFILEEYKLLEQQNQLQYDSLQQYNFVPKKPKRFSYSEEEEFEFQSKSNTKQISLKVDLPPSRPKSEIDSQIHNIISSEQILTFSQLKQFNNENQLKSSESRKRSQQSNNNNNNNNTSDIFQYSQSYQTTLKRPIEQFGGDNSIQFNLTNQFLSPQQKNINSISEFNTEGIALNFEKNNLEIKESNTKNEDIDEEINIEDL